MVVLLAVVDDVLKVVGTGVVVVVVDVVVDVVVEDVVDDDKYEEVSTSLQNGLEGEGLLEGRVTITRTLPMAGSGEASLVARHS